MEKAGLNVQQRKGLFWGLCIWARLALAVAVFFAARTYPKITAIIVLIAAVLGCCGNAYQHYKHKNVWWSRPSHILLLSLLALASILVLLNIIPPTSLAIFVALDVFFGIGSALLLKKP